MASISAANNVHAAITTIGMVGSLLFTATSSEVSPERSVIWTSDVTEIKKQTFRLLQDNKICRMVITLTLHHHIKDQIVRYVKREHVLGFSERIFQKSILLK